MGRKSRLKRERRKQNKSPTPILDDISSFKPVKPTETHGVYTVTHVGSATRPFSMERFKQAEGRLFRPSDFLPGKSFRSVYSGVPSYSIEGSVGGSLGPIDGVNITLGERVELDPDELFPGWREKT